MLLLHFTIHALIENAIHISRHFNIKVLNCVGCKRATKKHLHNTLSATINAILPTTLANCALTTTLLTAITTAGGGRYH